MPENLETKPRARVPSRDIQKALARGNALWDIIGQSDIPVSLARKIGVEAFDKLSDGEKLLVVKLATSFLRASDEIEKTFKEQEEKAKREADEAKATEAIEAQEIETGETNTNEIGEADEVGPSGTEAPEVEAATETATSAG